jgi:hypothetical protein
MFKKYVVSTIKDRPVALTETQRDVSDVARFMIRAQVRFSTSQILKRGKHQRADSHKVFCSPRDTHNNFGAVSQA